MFITLRYIKCVIIGIARIVTNKHCFVDYVFVIRASKNLFGQPMVYTILKITVFKKIIRVVKITHLGLQTKKTFYWR